MSGRSRGRARTTTAPQAPAAATPSGAPTPPITPTIIPTPTPTTMVTGVAQIPPARVASPQRAPVPAADTGRGRGIASTEQPAPSQPTSSTSVSSGAVSPTGAGSEGSPPQQPSPPHPAGGTGRAALRGASHQPSLSTRGDIITPMERLALQDTGDVRAGGRVEARIESVLHTRPANCTVKSGSKGDPVKILCNYFEVVNQPDWVLYQYHVDYLPVIDSRRMRIALFRNHDALFPLNKAFDGSTLYSLTKLPDEVIFTFNKNYPQIK